MTYSDSVFPKILAAIYLIDVMTSYRPSNHILWKAHYQKVVESGWWMKFSQWHLSISLSMFLAGIWPWASYLFFSESQFIFNLENMNILFLNFKWMYVKFFEQYLAHSGCYSEQLLAVPVINKRWLLKVYPVIAMGMKIE